MPFKIVPEKIVVKEVVVAQEMPEIRLRETDQSDPQGRYRLRVQGDRLLIERKINAGAEWISWMEILEMDSAGLVHFGGPENP